MKLKGRPPAGSAPALRLRPCPACGAATDADGRCAPCRLVLATAAHRPGTGGCEPIRTCPTHGTRTLTADGWCRQGGWHVAGPRLERDGAVYREREVPIPIPRAELRRRLGALLGAVTRPVSTVTAADVALAERGDAWVPTATDAEADGAARGARRRLLAQQAATLRGQTDAP